MKTLYHKALGFATYAHGDQQRKYTGEKYIVHPIAVAEKLKALGLHDSVLCSALLHDVLEDTHITEHEMEREFGPVITRMVVDLTDVYTTKKFPNIRRKERKMLECYRLWNINGNSKSIKLSDIIDNTPSIMEFGGDFAKVFLMETRELLQVLQGGDQRLMEEATRGLLTWEKKLYYTK